MLIISFAFKFFKVIQDCKNSSLLYNVTLYFTMIWLLFNSFTSRELNLVFFSICSLSCLTRHLPLWGTMRRLLCLHGMQEGLLINEKTKQQHAANNPFSTYLYHRYCNTKRWLSLKSITDVWTLKDQELHFHTTHPGGDLPPLNQGLQPKIYFDYLVKMSSSPDPPRHNWHCTPPTFSKGPGRHNYCCYKAKAGLIYSYDGTVLPRQVSAPALYCPCLSAFTLSVPNSLYFKLKAQY